MRLAQPPLYTIQGSKQLQLLIGTIRNQDDTGDLARAPLEFEQQESGYITPILHADTSTEYQRWSPYTWISSIKQFLSTMKGTVQIFDQWCPTAQRQHDKSLMFAFQHKYGKQKKKLAQLNRCRIWLQVTTLSDVTASNGTSLCPYALRGEKHPHRRSNYKWRGQNDMNKKAWKTWSAALKTTFTSNGLQLHTPLGEWCDTIQSQMWPTYKDTEHTLYMAPTQIGATWTAHRLIGINATQGLMYNPKGIPRSPQKKTVKISLRSRTFHTLIFSNSITR